MKNREIIVDTIKNANFQTLKNIIIGLKREQILTQSASVTYFLLISIVPFFMVILAIVGLTDIDVLKGLGIERGDIPDEIYNLIDADFTASISDIDITTLIFMTGVVFMASSFFNRIISIGNKVYNEEGKITEYKDKITEYKGNIIINKMLSIVLLLMIIGMITLHIYFTGKLSSFIGNTPSVFESSYGPFLSWLLSFSARSISVITMLMCVNWFISPSKMNFRKTMIGSSVTFGIWSVSNYVFFDVIEHSPIWKIFGDLAIYVVFIYWVFLLAYGFIVGVITNKEYIYEKYFN